MLSLGHNELRTKKKLKLHITGPLGGESTSDWWVALTKASSVERVSKSLRHVVMTCNSGSIVTALYFCKIKWTLETSNLNSSRVASLILSNVFVVVEVEQWDMFIRNLTSSVTSHLVCAWEDHCTQSTRAQLWVNNYRLQKLVHDMGKYSE